jgi:Rps23 Pro-64 3,4-dihydroxylase Tpa1-like proline 4-hydroxylase
MNIMLNDNLVNEIQKKIVINNNPFPNIIIKNTLPLEIIKKAEKEFISFNKFNTNETFRYGRPKFSLSKFDEMPFTIKEIISFFNSKIFLNLLEKNFNLKNLIPDWNMWGAGMHGSSRGRHLTVHSDFIYQRKTNTRRVLNLLLYLNSDWKDEWNGQIELWDKKMTKKVQSLSPLLNNMLIFRTDKDSNHGFPDKIVCPEQITRKSIALYYYVKEERVSPIQIKKRKYYTTVWKKRPNSDDPDFMDRDNLWRRIKYKYLPRFFLNKDQ